MSEASVTSIQIINVLTTSFPERHTIHRNSRNSPASTTCIVYQTVKSLPESRMWVLRHWNTCRWRHRQLSWIRSQEIFRMRWMWNKSGVCARRRTGKWWNKINCVSGFSFCCILILCFEFLMCQWYRCWLRNAHGPLYRRTWTGKRPWRP